MLYYCPSCYPFYDVVLKKKTELSSTYLEHLNGGNKSKRSSGGAVFFVNRGAKLIDPKIHQKN